MSPSMRAAMIVLPGAVAVVAALLAAHAFAALTPPPWASEEAFAFGVWSVPLGVIVAGVALLIRRAWGEFSIVWRALGSMLAGAALGVAYAFGAYFVSGGAVMSFAVPVLYCWVAGAIVGLATACLIRSEL
jgi:hypothetical protein